MVQDGSATTSMLVNTKLRPPQLREDLVKRPRLFERIGPHLPKLLLVSAPAGFGKTTFILKALRSRHHNFAWLALDELDNDPRRFMSHLLEAKIHFEPSYFLNRTPVNVHLVVLTRVDPLLPLGRLRVRNELVGIRERDLRFTIDEAVEFFRSTMKLNLARDLVEALEIRTEGWIAALQMAAVSLQDGGDAERFVKAFTGSNRYVVEYLLEEVLSRQSDLIQTFLLRTSILSNFNADVCEAVEGERDVRSILASLEAANLFLVTLDESGEWYRYHHLFRELLNYRLRQTRRSEVPELHRRASTWFEEQGEITTAIHHAKEHQSQ